MALFILSFLQIIPLYDVSYDGARRADTPEANTPEDCNRDPPTGLGQWETAFSPEQNLAIERIKHFGGKVSLDTDRAARPILGITLSKTKVTDDDLVELNLFPNLTLLFLTDTDITDSGLGKLGRSRNLSYLTERCAKKVRFF